MNGSSTPQLHQPVIDDVTETEFDGVGEILKEKDESGIPGEEKVKEGRRILGGRVESSMMVVEGRRRGSSLGFGKPSLEKHPRKSSLGFGRKLSLGIEQSHRRHSEHRLKVLQCC